jgi:hypothetical protein
MAVSVLAGLTACGGNTTNAAIRHAAVAAMPKVVAAAPATSTPSPSASPPGARDGTRPQPLKASEEPPQFIVTSFDGAGNVESWRRWLDLARRDNATMTFFLSGTYLLPADKANLYDPPHHNRGASDIGFSTAADVRPRMDYVRQAYLAGNEIGTHFNGHFCGPTGVARWTSADWTSELDQFNRFLTDWRTNNDALDAAPTPFGLEAIVGERTPCLEGKRAAMLPVLAARGFRYDTSGDGDLRWPRKFDNGMWNIPMEELRMAGSGAGVLSMDYNFYDQQSHARYAPAARQDAMRRQMLMTYRNAYTAVYNGNRAPLILGNHFAKWNNGIYADAMATFLDETCQRPQTRCVSFTQLIDWMEAQSTDTLAGLQARRVQDMPY